MFTRIAHLVANSKATWAIVIIWFVVAGLSRLVPAAKTSTQQQDLLPASDDSIVASHLATNPAKFPRSGSQVLPMLIVFRDQNGLSSTDVERARAVSDYLNNPGQRPAGVTGVSSIFIADRLAPGAALPADPRFLASDRKTLTITALFGAKSDSAIEKQLVDPVKQVEQAVKDRAAGDPALQTGVAGQAAQLADAQKAFGNLNGTLTEIAVLLVIALLLVIYRSPILPFVPLVSVGLAYVISQGAFNAIARGLNLVVNPQSTSLALVLILGAGTDYAMFIISRYREELRQFESKYDAMWHTMANIGEAIASSALIVVATLLTLLLASISFFGNLGPSAALAIAFMLVAGLTFVPAVLLLFGRRAFWPFMPRYGERHGEESGVWGWIAGVVSRRPAIVLGTIAVLFIGLALATAGLQQRYDFVSNFPTNYPSRQGQQLLEKAGPADIGKLSPTQVYVTSAHGPVLSHLDQLNRLADALAQVPGVQAVTGFGGPAPPSAAAIRQQNGALPPTQRSVSADGTTAVVTVYFNRDPYSAAAMDLITPLRHTARGAAGGSDLRVNVGGETAVQADTRSDVTRDELLLGPIIFLAIGIILGLLLRSAVAPLYLLATTLLSFLATLGLTSLIFQHVVNSGGIQDFVPPFMAVFLTSLGADYNVFIMTRVREESRRLGIHDGARRAIARTGTVITSAGIILAGTFAALIALPLSLLQQIGFAVAAGILLDTFVVRVLMVPSIVFLLGRWNWWPSGASKKEAAPTPVPQPVGD